MEAADLYLRGVNVTFGPHSDAEWRFMTENVVRSNPDGSLRLHYDPAIAVPFNAQPSGPDVELWSLYDSIQCPTLLLRGEQSDLLTHDTANKMSRHGPRAGSSRSPASATRRR
jgi:hypothetical protein